MRKFRSLILLFLLAFMLTGCVKYNATMAIKKDKAMDFKVIFAIDTSVFGDDSEALEIKDIDKLKKQGFTIEEYQDPKNKDMKGYLVSRSIKNIDEVSSPDYESYSLSKMVDEDNTTAKLFKIEKGLFKNTYKANFEFDASDSDLSNEDIDSNLDDDSSLDTDFDGDDYDYDSDYDYNDDMDLDYNYDANSGGASGLDLKTKDYQVSELASNNDDDLDFDLNKLMGSMDLSFNVSLPYEALSSNATSKNNDGKDLSWSLTANEVENIQFEFALYNMFNIYLALGGGILLLGGVIAVVIILMKKKKGQTNSKTPTPEVTNAQNNIDLGLNQPFEAQSIDANGISNQNLDGEEIKREPQIIDNNLGGLNNAVDVSNSPLASNGEIGVSSQPVNNTSYLNISDNEAMNDNPFQNQVSEQPPVNNAGINPNNSETVSNNPFLNQVSEQPRVDSASINPNNNDQVNNNPFLNQVSEQPPMDSTSQNANTNQQANNYPFLNQPMETYNSNSTDNNDNNPYNGLL